MAEYNPSKIIKDGNTYNFRDANAVDLTSNQTVGGIKTFSNAPVVGSINLDGKSIDTDANGDMTYDGNKVLTSAIKEGDYGNRIHGWCLLYGDLLIQWGSDSSTSSRFSITFAKPFSNRPLVIANYGDVVNYNTPCAIADSATTTNFEAVNSGSGVWRVNWIAIGKGA